MVAGRVARVGTRDVKNLDPVNYLLGSDIWLE